MRSGRSTMSSAGSRRSRSEFSVALKRSGKLRGWKAEAKEMSLSTMPEAVEEILCILREMSGGRQMSVLQETSAELQETIRPEVNVAMAEIRRTKQQGRREKHASWLRSAM